MVGYKINWKKRIALLYINDKGTEKEIKETSPFTIATDPQITKYLGVTLTKEVKDLYDKNFRSLKKEIEEDIRKQKPPMLLDRQDQHCKNGNPIKSNLQI